MSNKLEITEQSANGDELVYEITIPKEPDYNTLLIMRMWLDEKCNIHAPVTTCGDPECKSSTTVIGVSVEDIRKASALQKGRIK